MSDPVDIREADVLDRAAALSQRLNDAYVVEVQRKAAPQQEQLPDGTWPHPDCIECGVEIPTMRLALGRYRCVDCQTAVESSARFAR